MLTRAAPFGNGVEVGNGACVSRATRETTRCTNGSAVGVGAVGGTPAGVDGGAAPAGVGDGGAPAAVGAGESAGRLGRASRPIISMPIASTPRNSQASMANAHGEQHL